MTSGYKILWTNHALSELKNTIDYLEEHWTERELKKFTNELNQTVELISKNPKLFMASDKKSSVRRAVVAKFNNLYYQYDKDSVVKLSFFSNRQNPDKLKI